MAEPFLSEIRIMSFIFAPKGWALCDGQVLPISQNQGLFSLLGTTFGGDGVVNCALPDFRGRVPIHVGGGHTLGERGGERVHTVNNAELPQHTHLVNAADRESSAVNSNNPAGRLFSNSKPASLYSDQLLNAVPLSQGTVTNIGGTQPHQNMQPYLTLNFCIALVGIFPSST
jgi:microcystin-dependent protein